MLRNADSMVVTQTKHFAFKNTGSRLKKFSFSLTENTMSLREQFGEFVGRPKPSSRSITLALT
jgi:hypothetical protein